MQTHTENIYASEKTNNKLGSTSAYEIRCRSFDHGSVFQNYWESNSNESNDSAFYEPNEALKDSSDPNSPKKSSNESKQSHVRKESGYGGASSTNSSYLISNDLEKELL